MVVMSDNGILYVPFLFVLMEPKKRDIRMDFVKHSTDRDKVLKHTDTAVIL